MASQLRRPNCSVVSWWGCCLPRARQIGPSAAGKAATPDTWNPSMITSAYQSTPGTERTKCSLTQDPAPGVALARYFTCTLPPSVSSASQLACTGLAAGWPGRLPISGRQSSARLASPTAGHELDPPQAGRCPATYLSKMSGWTSPAPCRYPAKYRTLVKKVGPRPRRCVGDALLNL